MTQQLRVGRYETLRPIAAGGMATVYLGRARGAGGFERHVAIKVMHPHLATDRDFVTMFLDEARMAANLRHPNVVPTLDVAQDEDGLFLVMEFIDGMSLNDMLRSLHRQRRRMPMPIAIRLVLDILAGLHAAHELKTEDGQPMNLVHRDVSPQNVLVGKEGVARIMDFGIARAETRIASTRGRTLKGKIPYMSPERIRAKPVDRRVDIYAVGVVLWELLAGRRLFRADDEVVLITLALEGPQQSPCEINHEVPVPINRVCMKALAAAPEGRFQTAADFAEALEEAALEADVRVATPRGVAALLSELPVPPPRTRDSSSDVASSSSNSGAAAAMASGSRERIPAPAVPPPRTPSDSGVSDPSVSSVPSVPSAPGGALPMAAAAVPASSDMQSPRVPTPATPPVAAPAPAAPAPAAPARAAPAPPAPAPPAPVPAAPAPAPVAEPGSLSSLGTEEHIAALLGPKRSGPPIWMIAAAGGVVAVAAGIGVAVSWGPSDETQAPDESAELPSEPTTATTPEPAEPLPEPDTTVDDAASATPTASATATAKASATAKATKPPAKPTKRPPKKPPARPPVRPPSPPSPPKTSAPKAPPTSPTTFRPEEP